MTELEHLQELRAKELKVACISSGFLCLSLERSWAFK